MASGFAKVTGNFVAVHDAARPLIDARTFSRVCEDAAAFGAAILATPVKATVKEVISDSFVIKKTVTRKNLWEAQTPQVFRTSLLAAGLEQAKTRLDFVPTDDAALVEEFADVHITPGDGDNLKITNAEDLIVAEALLRAKKSRWVL
jgi:2-C-methyl-D-erythritol 4-phosphate cytidylyltransferase